MYKLFFFLFFLYKHFPHTQTSKAGPQRPDHIRGEHFQSLCSTHIPQLCCNERHAVSAPYQLKMNILPSIPTQNVLGSITIQDWRSGLHHNSRLTFWAPSQIKTDVGSSITTQHGRWCTWELTNIWWWNGFCFKGKQWITPGIGVDMPWSMKPTNTLSLLSQHYYYFTEHGRAGEGLRPAKTTCVVTASVHVGCQDVDMRKQDHRVVSN